MRLSFALFFALYKALKTTINIKSKKSLRKKLSMYHLIVPKTQKIE